MKFDIKIYHRGERLFFEEVEYPSRKEAIESGLVHGDSYTYAVLPDGNPNPQHILPDGHLRLIVRDGNDWVYMPVLNPAGKASLHARSSNGYS